MAREKKNRMTVREFAETSIHLCTRLGGAPVTAGKWNRKLQTPLWLSARM